MVLRRRVFTQQAIASLSLAFHFVASHVFAQSSFAVSCVAVNGPALSCTAPVQLADASLRLSTTSPSLAVSGGIVEDWAADIVQLSQDTSGAIISANTVGSTIDASALTAPTMLGASFAFRCRQISPSGANQNAGKQCSSSIKIGAASIAIAGTSMGADAGVPPQENRFYFKGATTLGRLQMCRGSRPTTGSVCNSPILFGTEQEFELDEVKVAITTSTSAQHSDSVASNDSKLVGVRRSTGGDTRGCSDDLNVPLLHSINSASPAPIPQIRFLEMSTYGWPSVQTYPNAISIEILVPAGSIAGTRSIEFTGYSGSTINDSVISRCRGSFVDSGLAVKHGVSGIPEEVDTPWPAWDIGVPTPVGSPRSRGRLYEAGQLDPGLSGLSNPWISDGRYYINIRQTACTSTSTGVCTKRYAL